MDAESRRSLRLFNERAARLRGSRFLAEVEQATSVSATFKWEAGGSLETSSTMPDREAVEAFALTFRLFLQNNERVSIRRIAEIYDQPWVGIDVAARFRRARTSLNEFLDEPTFIIFNNRRLTRRNVVDVFLYGDLAHTEKSAEFEAWRTAIGGTPLFELVLVDAFIGTFNFITWTSSLNESLIGETQPA
ncbi:MAG: hypothetical protein O3C25_04355 [Chloroflexi bacterium]|nr:hypothetical protein [Chloroflexota bacterium]